MDVILLGKKTGAFYRCQQEGHLRVTATLPSNFCLNRICNIRRDAAIIAFSIDEFIAKLLAVVSGRPNLASLGGHRLEQNNKAPCSGLIANMAQPFRRQRHGHHHRLRGTAEMPL